MQLSRSLVARVAIAALILFAPLAALAALAGRLPTDGLASVALAFAVAAIALVGGVSTLPYRELQAWSTATMVGSIGALSMATGLVLARSAHGGVGAEIASGWIGSVGVLLLAGSLGAVVGFRVGDAGHLVAVALASSAADVWSVHAPEGVTRSLVETTDTALQRLLAISSAVPPSPLPVAVIGAGDALFAALYLSAAVRHGLAYRRVALALGAGLLAAGALTFVFHRALPALPFLGAAVLAVEPRARRVARRDRGPTLVAAAILLGAVLRVVLR